MQYPIIVEQQRVRDCIVVSGKKYCEESDLTGRELGFILLGVALVGLWLFKGLDWSMDSGRPGVFAAFYFGIPIGVIIAGLIYFG